MWAGPGTRPTGERGALPRLPDAAQGERIEQRLLGGPEGDLDLDSHPRCGEAEHVAGVVVTRDRRNPGVLVGEVEGVRHPAGGIGLLPAGEEGLWPCRPRCDRPALDLDRGVPGTSAAATDGVEAERGFRIAPGLGAVGGAVELDPAPEAAGATGFRRVADRRVVAVERQTDLPHVVVGTTAVRAG